MYSFWKCFIFHLFPANIDSEVTEDNNFQFFGDHGQRHSEDDLNKESDIDTNNLALADNLNSANALKRTGHAKEIPRFQEVHTDDSNNSPKDNKTKTKCFNKTNSITKKVKNSLEHFIKKHVNNGKSKILKSVIKDHEKTTTDWQCYTQEHELKKNPIVKNARIQKRNCEVT